MKPKLNKIVYTIYRNSITKSTVVTDYEINTYTNSFDFICKIEEIEITYSVPLNKGYKIIAEV